MVPENPGGDALLLAGKRLLITGVLTNDSIAWHTARLAQEQGAAIVVTGFGRGLRLTERAARRLPDPPDVLELDINNPDHLINLTAALTDRWGAIDGGLHAIAYAPGDALGGNFLSTPPESAQIAFMTSAFSFKTLAVGLLPLLQAAGGGSLVTLDFDNRQAWPAYDWMGVSKAALESVTRYLARYSRPGPHPGQRHFGRSTGNRRRQVDPGRRPLRKGLGGASPARLGSDRSRTCCPHGLHTVFGLGDCYER